MGIILVTLNTNLDHLAVSYAEFCKKLTASKNVDFEPRVTQSVTLAKKVVTGYFFFLIESLGQEEANGAIPVSLSCSAEKCHVFEKGAEH